MVDLGAACARCGGTGWMPIQYVQQDTLEYRCAACGGQGRIRVLYLDLAAHHLDLAIAAHDSQVPLPPPWD